MEKSHPLRLVYNTVICLGKIAFPTNGKIKEYPKNVMKTSFLLRQWINLSKVKFIQQI